MVLVLLGKSTHEMYMLCSTTMYVLSSYTEVRHKMINLKILQSINYVPVSSKFIARFKSFGNVRSLRSNVSVEIVRKIVRTFRYDTLLC